MRPILALLAPLLFCVAAHAAPQDDSPKFSVFVVGDPQSAPAAWFDSDSMLKSIRQRVHFTVLPPEGTLFRMRYGGMIPGQPPHVICERPDGRVIYHASRGSMPDDGATLSAAMVSAVKRAMEATPAASVGAMPAAAPVEAVPPIESAALAQDYTDCDDGTCTPADSSLDDSSWFPRLDRDGDGDLGPIRLEPKGGFFKDASELVMLTVGGIGLLFVLGVGSIFVIAIVLIVVLVLSRSRR